ncbi:metallophosphoesterase family protein [Megasphaera stantonii]|uniref:Calcineurin-like phosphoesterase domain-containing protein n=1 Tax=Megasphaera stantonii TaxID=2144175 RepID=A0A346AWP9_9FIRM|nr:metallophosphoesterase [Megasphaera stantonii]AXL20292.1 hypothetical protein DKB62_01175 [Megasphaera stantonii]
MIYITGDIHGNPSRLEPASLRERGLAIGAQDYIIICGDFGLIWGGRHAQETERWLQWLSEQPFTTLFVDGNHENFDLLTSYPVMEWQGGKVHQIRNNIYHLMRGEIFTIDGSTFFCLGGAKSVDQARRIQGISWWPQEIPTIDEYKHATENLKKVGWAVDYVITHTAPSKWKNTADSLHAYDGCPVSHMLDALEEKLTYKRWFFGHLHINKYGKDRKDIWLYTDIVNLTGEAASPLAISFVENLLPEGLQRYLAEYRERNAGKQEIPDMERRYLRSEINIYVRRGTVSHETLKLLCDAYHLPLF